MKIWFQKHIVAGRIPLLDAAYESHMQKVVRPGTTVHFESLPNETYSQDLPNDLVAFGVAETLFGSYFASQAVVAERAGFDAFVIGTLPEPGLRTARALVDIPVLGYTSTAAHVASMLAGRIALINFVPPIIDRVRANLAREGLDSDRFIFSQIPSGVGAIKPALAGDPEPFLNEFDAEARKLIRDGAEVIIPGEALLNEVLYANQITSIDGVPVIDTDGLVVKMAELFVELRALGIADKAHRGYWQSRPDKQTIDHLLRLFQPTVAQSSGT